MLEERRHKHLVLIVARDFASLLATPMLVSDADGRLVYFNEPAESVLGLTYAEAGELPADEWSARFQVQDAHGRPLPLEQMPAGIAFAERRPAQGEISICSADGVRRLLSVSAFPLFAQHDQLVGVVALFWDAAADAPAASA